MGAVIDGEDWRMASVADHIDVPETDIEAIVAAALDYLEGFLLGDADIASVRVYSCHWVDFLHIVRARGEWKLFHVTWHPHTTT